MKLTKKTLRAAFREARETLGKKVPVEGLGNVWAERIIKSRLFGIVGVIYFTDSKLFEIAGRPEVTQFGGWDLEHGLDVITRKARREDQ